MQPPEPACFPAARSCAVRAAPPAPPASRTIPTSIATAWATVRPRWWPARPSSAARPPASRPAPTTAAASTPPPTATWTPACAPTRSLPGHALRTMPACRASVASRASAIAARRPAPTSPHPAGPPIAARASGSAHSPTRRRCAAASRRAARAPPSRIRARVMATATATPRRAQSTATPFVCGPQRLPGQLHRCDELRQRRHLRHRRRAVLCSARLGEDPHCGWRPGRRHHRLLRLRHRRSLQDRQPRHGAHRPIPGQERHHQRQRRRGRRRLARGRRGVSDRSRLGSRAERAGGLLSGPQWRQPGDLRHRAVFTQRHRRLRQHRRRRWQRRGNLA